jgi:hypothetical protein
MSIKVSVQAVHIANAKPYPNLSPTALALRDMGYADATVTHHYAYFNNEAYPLPIVAINSELQFDFLAKNGSLQGETIADVKPFEFEL